MSENKIYVPRSSVKQISDRLIKISFKAAEFRDFMNEHVNDRGYINLCLSPRKEKGQYGDTHTCFLDTWKPDPNRQPAQRQARPVPPPSPQPEPEPEMNLNPPSMDDEVPF